MKYSNDQWAKCRWRIDNLQTGKPCYEEYTELLDLFKPIIEAYRSAEDVPFTLDNLIRYIILVYHRFSPYAINEQNIIKRKIEACELLGLNPEKSEIVAVIANKNRFVNNAALWFLKQDDGGMDWLELEQYIEAYYQVMAALTDNSVQDTSKTLQDIAKTKLGIVKEMKGIKSEIEQLSAKVFREDNDLLNYVERYKKAEAESFIVLSPEDYVRSKRAGDNG